MNLQELADALWERATPDKKRCTTVSIFRNALAGPPDGHGYTASVTVNEVPRMADGASVEEAVSNLAEKLKAKNLL